MGRIYGYKVDALEDEVRSMALVAASSKNPTSSDNQTGSGDNAATDGTTANPTAARGRRRRIVVRVNDDDDVDLTPAASRIRTLEALSERICSSNEPTTAQSNQTPVATSSAATSGATSSKWYERIAAQTATNRPLSYRRTALLQRRQNSAAAATFGRRRLHKRIDDDIDFPCNYAVFTQCLDVVDGSLGDAGLALRVPEATAMLPGDKRRRPFPMFRSTDYMRATYDLIMTCMTAEYGHAMRYQAEMKEVSAC